MVSSTDNTAHDINGTSKCNRAVVISLCRQLHITFGIKVKRFSKV